MSNTWLKVKVWTKLGVFFFVLLYLLVFVAKNSGQSVQFWYWYNGVWPTSLLYFAFFTFLAGMLVAFLAGTIRKTLGQFRELRHHTERERRDRELLELRAKSASADVASSTQSVPLTDPPATP